MPTGTHHHLHESCSTLPSCCSYGRGGERGTARPEVLQELLKTTDRVVQVGLALGRACPAWNRLHTALRLVLLHRAPQTHALRTTAHPPGASAHSHSHATPPPLPAWCRRLTAWSMG